VNAFLSGNASVLQVAGIEAGLAGGSDLPAISSFLTWRDRMSARLIFIVAVSAFAAAPVAGANGPWPAQPIRFIVPFPAGGAGDLVSRPVAEQLRERLGQAVVVENVAGASGALGTGRFANAAPDGYTLGQGNSATQTILPHLGAKLPYDPGTLTPISMLSEYGNVLVVANQLPARSMKEFLALARARPQALSYGSAGNGSSNHMASELLAIRAGVKFLHVPYKGNAPALADVAAGHLDWMFATVAEIKGFVQAGRVRALAVSDPAPDPMMPDLPTVRDTLPGFEVTGFIAAFGPPGLSEAIKKRLNSEINAILTTPEIVARLAAAGIRARPSTSEELARRIADDSAMWKSVITMQSIKAD
jgi:tripartite-type tricarboxylate transporter receptor subunit TctC